MAALREVSEPATCPVCGDQNASQVVWRLPKGERSLRHLDCREHCWKDHAFEILAAFDPLA